VPEDIVRWTDGRAVMATGSPFAPVTHGDREIHIGQGNNAFIFPGLGLGTLISGAREVTDGMIAAAANALANTVTEEELAKGFLFPPIPRLREVSMALTKAVIEKAVSEGTAALNDVSDIDGLIEAQSWSSDYARLRAE